MCIVRKGSAGSEKGKEGGRESESIFLVIVVVYHSVKEGEVVVL